MKKLKLPALLVFAMSIVGCGTKEYKPIVIERTFDTAYLDYYWDDDKDGTGSYELYLIKGDGESGNFAWLDLECFSASSTDITRPELAPGTYKLSKTGDAFTFQGHMKIYNETGIFEGNGEEEQDDGLQEYVITGGYFTLSVSGNQYTVSTDFDLDNGTKLKGAYSGKVSYPFTAIILADAAMTNISEAYAGVYRGLWAFEMYDHSTDESVRLMINADPALTEVPTGNFQMAEGPLLGIRGTAEPGSSHKDKIRKGCWYSKKAGTGESFSYATGGEGHVNISGTEGAYTVDFSFTGLDGYVVSGSYSGEIPISTFTGPLWLSLKAGAAKE